ncbi:MAG: glucans biosynthesis protein [Verrucomicrobia bacterium]|nr:MAG: glucans biosynthesis protein [Verrucomicrobiota bacterium]
MKAYANTWRRGGALAVIVLGGWTGLGHDLYAATNGMDFEQVKAKARELASRPIREDRLDLAQKLREITYDQMREIRFDPREAVWRRERLPFQLQFFHPGGPQQTQIDVFLVDGDAVSELPFSRDFFSYGTNKFNWFDMRGLKFSGFRVHYPLNRPDVLDELIVFQGATYFRALAQNLIYGLSARALAVNCGGPGMEEFPRFRTFWIHRPDKEGAKMLVLGLFEGPSLTGAAAFLVKPGAQTVVEARVAVFARTDLPRYGIAPLTSMFWYGKNTARKFADFRPEVHDSDGLLMQTSAGEWLWRPLENDGRLRMSLFRDKQPKGFGLFQRERNFAAYEDLEALYQRRPSAWVRPTGDWGEGAIKLVEIETENEFMDNIVAFWEPANGLKAGGTAEFAYQLVWLGDDPALPPLGRCLATRTGWAGPRTKKFVLDLVWPTLAREAEGGKVEPVVHADHGKVNGLSSEFNPYDKTWRLAFNVTADDKADAVGVRATLKAAGQPQTETWTYLWRP